MKNIFRNFLIVILICGFLILSWHDVVFGMWDHDSGYYLLTSYLMNLDFAPFVDFPLQYPPLMIQINAWILKLGISHEKAVIYIPLMWIYANGTLTFITSFRLNKSLLLSSFYTLIFGLFSVENGGNHVTLEHGILFFALVTYNLIISKRYFKTYLNYYYITIGFFIGCIFLVKQVGILLVPYFLVSIFDEESFKKCIIGVHKKALFMLIGFTASVLLVFAHIKANYKIVFSQLFHRIANYVSNSPDSRFSITSEFDRSPFTFFVIVLLPLMFGIGFFLKKQSNLQKLKVFLLFSAAVAYVAARAVRNYPHYTLNAWFPILIIAISTFTLPVINIKHFSSKRGSFIISSLLLLVVFTSIILTVYKKPNNFYKYSEINEFFIPGSRAIKEMTKDSPRILQLGEEPIIEFLTYKIPQRLDYEWAWKYDIYDVVGNPTIIINNFNRPDEVRVKEQQLIVNGYTNVYTTFSGDEQRPNRELKLWMKK